jgi:hypothetical protein
VRVARLAGRFVFEFVVVLLGYSDPADPMDALSVPRAEWESVAYESRSDDCGLIQNWR